MVCQNHVFEGEKQIFPGSAQTCSESIDFDIIFAKSGWLAKNRVFLLLFCVFNGLGIEKCRFSNSRGSFSRFSEGLGGVQGGLVGAFGAPIVFVGLLMRK